MKNEEKKEEVNDGGGRGEPQDQNKKKKMKQPDEKSEKGKKWDRKIIIRNSQSPGDILMLTAAVRDLKLSYPDIAIDVRTSCGEIWENNPHLTKLDNKEPDVEFIKADYPLIHNSNEGQYHFIHGFRKFLEERLRLRIKATKFKADIHISEEEKGWMSQVEEMGVKDKFWIIMAGGKYDFTAKWWNPDFYQKVVDHFKGKITFVQCLHKNSFILTQRGLKRIKDVKKEDNILTEYGPKKCSGAIYKGVKKLTKVVTNLGDEILATKDHKLKVVEDGRIIWKEVKDIKDNDFLLMKYGHNGMLINADDSNNVELWYLVGHLWGDGLLHRVGKHEYLEWVISEDEIELKDKIISYLENNNIKYSEEVREPINDENRKINNIVLKGNKCIYRIRCRRDFFNEYFPPYKRDGKWREDGFLKYYSNLSIEEWSNFINGLVSTDGCVLASGKRIKFTSVYKEVVQDCRKILNMLGVITSLTKSCQYDTISYSLMTNGYNSFVKFATVIPISCKHKRDKINKYLSIKNLVISGDKILGFPNPEGIIKRIFPTNGKDIDANDNVAVFIRECKKGKKKKITDKYLKKIIRRADKFGKSIDDLNTLKEYIDNDFYCGRVVSIIHDFIEDDVYDILNSETDSYLANGFVSHNCGEKNHWHPPLRHVISLIGKTDLRQFIRLIYHSIGVLSPVTFAMHAAAAIECRHDLLNRPCVVLAGGREPSQWEKYPHHRFLETNGCLSCCDNGGCWKSRCHKVGDGDNKDEDEELCLHPVKVKGNIHIPKCMFMIKPKDVIRAIEMYYDGGVLEYGSSING